MRIKTILFDLDGTLLPMDNDEFTKGYFKLLASKLAGFGYDPKSLVDGVWAGTAAMVRNDGGVTNEEAFWKKFESIYGEKCVKDRPLFDEFYIKEFQNARSFCGFNSDAKDIVDFAKAKGFQVVLSTNPLFPSVATESRINWAGLGPSDFLLYTTYENSRFCKPNLNYYTEITKKLNCNPNECLVVGNDVDEDMIASTLGMKVFLLSDCLINKSGKDISNYPNGGFAELKTYIEQLF